MAFSIAVRAKRAAQLDLAPTLAVFAWRSVISTPPRFVRDYSAPATLAVFLGTHRLRISDAERDQGASRKPSWNAIRESRIATYLWKNVSSPPSRPGLVNLFRLKAAKAGKLIVRRLHNQCRALKVTARRAVATTAVSTAGITTSIRAAASDCEARRLFVRARAIGDKELLAQVQ